MSTHPADVPRLSLLLMSALFLSPAKYVPSLFISVLEVPEMTILPTVYPLLPTKWDFTEYQGRPPGWVDPFELKKRREQEIKDKQDLQVTPHFSSN